MEQVWTVDRQDVALNGDLEFWAQRHGYFPPRPDDAPSLGAPADSEPAQSGAMRAARRVAPVAWLSVAVGLTLPTLVLLGRASANMM